MVSINKTHHHPTQSDQSQTHRNNQQGISLAKWGVAAFAATNLIGKASASLPFFADLPNAGTLKALGGVKKLPASMQPGFATRDLVAAASSTVIAPPTYISNPGTWYGVSAPLNTVAKPEVTHLNRRLMGLTPFGGGGTPPSSSPATPTPPAPTTPSCSTPNPPQPSPTGSGSLITAQLQGCPMSDYSAAVNVGGQPFWALADTGSTTFGVVSYKCTNCETQTSYKPGSSSKDDNVNFEADYGKGKWLGELTTDTVSFAGGPSASIKFGAIYNQTDWMEGNGCDLTAKNPGPPINQAIMGLGTPALLLNGTDSWIEKTNSTFAYPAVTFGLCDQNGAIYLGGYPQNNAASTPIFTPMATLKESPYIAVAMEGLSVGQTDIGATLNDFGYTVVDTGSTGLIFPPDIYQAIATGISDATQDAITQDFFDTGDCVALASTTVAQLDAQAPALRFSFFNAANSSTVNTVTAPASISYLVAQDDGQGGLVVCPVLINAGSTNPISLLGNTMMRGFLTIFDYEKEQVGFAVSQNVCKSN